MICSYIHNSVLDNPYDFGFPIVNFPWLNGDLPRYPSYGIYISQFVRFARCCTRVFDSSKHFKTFGTGLQISQSSENVCKILRVMNFSSNLLQYRFKNLYLKDSFIQSSTVILSTK